MGDASTVALEGRAIGVDVFRIGAGGERIVAVDAAHGAGGEVDEAEVRNGGDGLAHTRILLHFGRDGDVRDRDQRAASGNSKTGVAELAIVRVAALRGTATSRHSALGRALVEWL